ncbi:MAG: GNAT family N-acetyltransferase [Tissierellia bacterium]|nr:GNAT family N-acetyltransferase [Tissierellia bacterium]
MKKMELKDVFAMRSWANNEHPLLASYDFWPREDYECRYWYSKKTELKSNEYFVYYYGEDCISYVSMKRISQRTRSAELGLVMDPKYQNQGLGHQILGDFLFYFFQTRGFQKMTLKVDLFNQRAIHLYESMGFQKKRRTYTLFGEVERIPEESRRDFIIFSGLALSKGMVMEVRACDFLKEKI